MGKFSGKLCDETGKFLANVEGWLEVREEGAFTYWDGNFNVPQDVTVGWEQKNFVLRLDDGRERKIRAGKRHDLLQGGVTMVNIEFQGRGPVK